MPVYPLTFKPVFKKTVWGGEKLKRDFNKNFPLAAVGESWEISCVPGSVSVVKNGVFEGRPLTEILPQHGAEILGKKVFAAHTTTRTIMKIFFFAFLFGIFIKKLYKVFMRAAER